MRLGNVRGRAAIIVEGGAVDVAAASGERFGPDVQSLYDEWDDFVTWADTVDPASAEVAAFAETELGPPVPRPRQVFAIGLNYGAHAAETGREAPSVPGTFTKFPACINDPFGDIEIPTATTDWEVELVAVIGRRADRVAATDGWDHIAGVTVGQDISERTMQFAAGGQFSLGKSFRGFAPIGPWLVTPDELADRDDLGLGCRVDGEVRQDGRTGDLIFDVPHLVAELSAVVPLLPGDLIFTGTPDGVGVARQPPVFLRPGSTLETWIEGIGTIRNRLVEPTA